VPSIVQLTNLHMSFSSSSSSSDTITIPTTVTTVTITVLYIRCIPLTDSSSIVYSRTPANLPSPTKSLLLIQFQLLGSCSTYLLSPFSTTPPSSNNTSSSHFNRPSFPGLLTVPSLPGPPVSAELHHWGPVQLSPSPLHLHLNPPPPPVTLTLFAWPWKKLATGMRARPLSTSPCCC
jgi:hypothetical protein